MTELINEVYWGPAYARSFGTGSQMKVLADESVEFHNNLMSPGQTIVGWSSSADYQGSRNVPQLPLLEVNRRYRIIIHEKVIPQNTLITRVDFFDNQGERIKTIKILGTTKTFTVPAESVDYRISLVNAGCTTVDFRRIEIAPASLGDILTTPILNQGVQNQELAGPLNVLLIKDKKHYRQYPLDLTSYFPLTRILPLTIAYQDLKLDSTRSVLQKQVAALHKSNTTLRLISCHPQLNSLVVNIQQQNPEMEILLANQAMPAKRDTQWWLTEDNRAVNWSSIYNSMVREWG